MTCNRPCAYPTLALLFLMMLACSCAGGRSLPNAETGKAGPESRSLAELETELEALQKPDTVDAGQWKQLRDELYRVLATRGLDRFTAAIPPSDKALVDDFSAEGDASEATFSWTYRNDADYDQNGEVNIADLTTIGINLFATSQDANWQSAQLADGDGNNEVNLADITPLGINFGNNIQSYRIENSASGSDPWTELAVVNVADGTLPPGGGFRTFSYTQSGVPDGSYRVVPTDGSGDGPASNVSSLIPSNPAPGDWNQPGGGPQNQNNTPVMGPTNEPGDSLTELILPQIANARMLADGFLYALNNADQLEKRNPDGSLVWTYTHSSRIRSYGMGSDGNIYCASTNCTVFALDSDMQLLWEYTLVEGEIPSFAAVHPDGNVIFWITEPSITGTNLPWSTQVLLLDVSGNLVEQQELPENEFENETTIAPNGDLYVALQGEPIGTIASYTFDGSGIFSEMDAPGKVEAGAGRSIVVSDWDLIYLDAGGGQPLQVLDLAGNLLWTVDASLWELGPGMKLYSVPSGDDISELEVYDSSGALVDSHDFGTTIFRLASVGASGRAWVRTGNPEFGIKSAIPGTPDSDWFYADLNMSLPSHDASDNYYNILNGVLTSLDAEGQLRYEISPAQGSSSGAMAAAADGSIYVPAPGRMLAYTSTLQLKWDLELLSPQPNQFISPRGGPVILSSGDIVQSFSDFFEGAHVAHISAIKPAGADEWQADYTDYWPSQVRNGTDDTVYVLLTDRVNDTAPLLKALDPASGNEKWSVDLGGANGNTIADNALAVMQRAEGDLIFCTNSANSIYCFDAAGNEVYDHDSGWSEGARSLHVLNDGSLLALQNSFGSAELLKLDASGNESWSETFSGGMREIAVSNDGLHIAGTDSDYTKGLSPADGNELWSVPNEVVELVDANGFPVFDGNGNLFVKRVMDLNCYDPDDGSLLWSYPLYGKYGILSGQTDNTGAPLLMEDGSIICAMEGNHLMKILP